MLCFLNPPKATPRETLLERAKASLRLFDAFPSLDPKQGDTRWRFWIDMHKTIRMALDAESLLTFQSHPDICPPITGGSGRHFLDRIVEYFGPLELETLLNSFEETICGRPKDLTCERGHYLTVTSMRHLYHTAMLRHYCTGLFNRTPAFVEVGGGFGNLARVACQYNLCSEYCIIDHPVMFPIQHFFLSDFLPQEDIAVIDEDGRYVAGSKASRVKLFPAALRETLARHVGRDFLLLSTMAMTEISRAGQIEYLEALDPEFIYLFGQYVNECTVSGQAACGDVRFSNEDLVYDVGRRFNKLFYTHYGYHFEFMGRRRG